MSRGRYTAEYIIGVIAGSGCEAFPKQECKNQGNACQ